MYQAERKNARVGRAAAFTLGSLLLCAGHAHADSRRDFMFERMPAGDYFTLDYFGTGAQLTLDHRQSIYGAANEATAGATALLGYPMGQLTAHSSLRVLFLELDASAAYRVVWRNLSFAPGPHGEYCARCDRASRRDQDEVLRTGPDTAHGPFVEGKLTLYFPLNEYVVGGSQLAARYEDSRERSYDWFFANIHDSGLIGRWESMLFVKHRDWGGIGPYLQVMFLPRGTRHETEMSIGFNAATRLGLIDRYDLLFLTFLMQPGDRYYGQHAYYSPVRALLVYRLILAL